MVTATLLASIALSRVPGGEGGPAPRAGGELVTNMGACCALWQEYKAVFYECSAMTGYNITEPMLHMARSVNSNGHPVIFPQLLVSGVGSPGEWARRECCQMS